MSGFFEYRRKKRVDRLTFACLVQTMVVDGEIDKTELDMLASMAKGLNITGNEAKKILKKPSKYTKNVKMNREEVVRILILVANMIAADSKITPQEEIMCKKLSASLGLKPDTVLTIAKDIVQKNMGEQEVNQEIGKMLEKFK